MINMEFVSGVDLRDQKLLSLHDNMLLPWEWKERLNITMCQYVF